MVIVITNTYGCGHRWGVVIVFVRDCNQLWSVFLYKRECGHCFYLAMWAWLMFLQMCVGVVIRSGGRGYQLCGFAGGRGLKTINLL